MACTFALKPPSKEKYELIVYPSCNSNNIHGAVVDYGSKNGFEEVDIIYSTNSAIVSETYQLVKAEDQAEVSPENKKILRPKYSLNLLKQEIKPLPFIAEYLDVL